MLADAHTGALVGMQVAVKCGEVHVIQLIDVVQREVREVAQEGVSNLKRSPGLIGVKGVGVFMG